MFAVTMGSKNVFRDRTKEILGRGGAGSGRSKKKKKEILALS